MLRQVVGDAADGIDCVGGQVDAAVDAVIHRKGANASRHELRQTHGARERTARQQRRDALLAHEQQEVPEFTREELGAARIIEG